MRGEIINFAFDIIKSGKIRAYGLQLRNWEKPNWFPYEVLCENFSGFCDLEKSTSRPRDCFQTSPR